MRIAFSSQCLIHTRLRSDVFFFPSFTDLEHHIDSLLGPSHVDKSLSDPRTQDTGWRPNSVVEIGSPESTHLNRLLKRTCSCSEKQFQWGRKKYKCVVGSGCNKREKRVQYWLRVCLCTGGDFTLIHLKFPEFLHHTRVNGSLVKTRSVEEINPTSARKNWTTRSTTFPDIRADEAIEGEQTAVSRTLWICVTLSRSGNMSKIFSRWSILRLFKKWQFQYFEQRNYVICFKFLGERSGQWHFQRYLKMKTTIQHGRTVKFWNTWISTRIQR